MANVPIKRAFPRVAFFCAEWPCCQARIIKWILHGSNDGCFSSFHQSDKRIHETSIYRFEVCGLPETPSHFCNVKRENKFCLRLLFSTVVGSIGLLVHACSLYHPVRTIQYNATTSVPLAEGKRITMLMCGPCHYNHDTKQFTGKKLEDSPAVFGKVYASNITRDSVHGIGSYTDAQLAYLIRTGVSKSGKLMPYMQRPNIADEDLRAIIAFLKSADKSVLPSSQTAGKTSYTALGKIALSTVNPLPYEETTVSKPKERGILLGKYLVDNLACYHCHSKSFVKLNLAEPEKSKGFMGGGNKLKDAERKTVKTPNLTPHATGLKDWTLSDFEKAITQGVSKDGSFITYPMPLYPELTHDEIASMYAYLQNLEPIDNAN